MVIIIKDNVKGFIGSNPENFLPGDIIVIGRNVPHYFINSINEIEVLHFRHDLFPLKIAEISEFQYIGLLLERSQQGILFRDNALFERTKKMLDRIDGLGGIIKLNELYLILDTLGRKENYKLISPETFNPENHITSNASAVQMTYNYLYTNYHYDVTLNALSEYAHQNPTALCRSFKRETGKTIFQSLNEIRIENACKLLIETDLGISHIAYKSGFTTLPHFNKQFRMITGKTPTEFKSGVKSKSTFS
jgi:AraC-like DNA-binding protein